ncbi:MAG: hypothetical protein WC460_00090 [Patescibacteria group bacterium]
MGRFDDDPEEGILLFTSVLLVGDILTLWSFLQSGDAPLVAFKDIPFGIIILIGVGILHFLAIGGSILVIRKEIMEEKTKKTKVQGAKEEKK